MKLTMLRVRRFGVLCCLAWIVGGCSAFHVHRVAMSFRQAEVVDGDSVFVVTINGKEFIHRSSSGAVQLSVNRQENAVRVRVTSGRGTFVETGMDYYYHIDSDGDVAYLGCLTSSWYKDEQKLRFEMRGFKPAVQGCCDGVR